MPMSAREPPRSLYFFTGVFKCQAASTKSEKGNIVNSSIGYINSNSQLQTLDYLCPEII